MPKRTNKLIVRISDKEKANIKEKAEKAQLTVSEYVRNLIVYGEVK